MERVGEMSRNRAGFERQISAGKWEKETEIKRVKMADRYKDWQKRDKQKDTHIGKSTDREIDR